MVLQAENVSFFIQQTQILQNISLHVQKQEVIGLIGPNGSGKSTLLKMLYRTLEPQNGNIWLFKEQIQRLSSKTVAKQLAVVGQEHSVLFEFKVKDMVAMGRSPHKGIFDADSNQDIWIVEQAMEQAGIKHLSERTFSSLSGGEKKRVIIGRALAQQAQVLVLDEPTNHLDIKHQLQLMDLIQSLPITVIAALHDLNIAATYCDRLYVLSAGEIAAHGKPKEVLTPLLLKQVFGVTAEVEIHPLTQKPHITYLPEQFSLKT